MLTDLYALIFPWITTTPGRFTAPVRTLELWSWGA